MTHKTSAYLNRAFSRKIRRPVGMLLRRIARRLGFPVPTRTQRPNAHIDGSAGASWWTNVDGQKFDCWVMAGEKAVLPDLSRHISPTAEIITLKSPSSAARITTQLAAISPSENALTHHPSATLCAPPYSGSEADFSVVTERLAKLLCARIGHLLPQDHPAQTWLGGLAVTLDDVIFRAGSEFWGVLETLKHRSAEHPVGLSAGSRDWACAFTVAAQALNIPLPRLQLYRDDACEAGIELLGSSEALAHEFLMASSPELRKSISDNLLTALKNHPKARSVHSKPQGRGGLLIVGRSFDRNYRSDLFAIAQASLAAGARVSFLPTAGKRGVSRIKALWRIWRESRDMRIVLRPLFALAAPFQFNQSAENGSVLDQLVADALEAGEIEGLDLAVLFAIRAELKRFLQRRLAAHLSAGASTAKAFEAVRPHALVLLPGRDYLSQVATFQARAKSIPSFDIQTVFVGPRSRYKSTQADFQTAIESHSRDVFQTFFGIEESRLLMTGCAKLGLVQKKARALSLQRLLDRAGLVVPPVLFAGSPFWESDRAIVLALIEAFKQRPGSNLIMRLHPTAPPQYRECCESLCANLPHASIEDRFDLAETLAMSSIVITRFSNVGLEAALLEKDVIVCDFSGEIVPIRLDQMGVAVAAYSPSDLREALRDLEVGGPLREALCKSRSEYLNKNPQLLESNPADRIVDHIKERVPNAFG